MVQFIEGEKEKERKLQEVISRRRGPEKERICGLDPYPWTGFSMLNGWPKIERIRRTRCVSECDCGGWVTMVRMVWKTD